MRIHTNNMKMPSKPNLYNIFKNPTNQNSQIPIKIKKKNKHSKELKLKNPSNKKTYKLHKYTIYTSKIETLPVS